MCAEVIKNLGPFWWIGTIVVLVILVELAILLAKWIRKK